MKKWTNRNLPGALHFVTGIVRDRRRIFSNPDNCIAFIEEMQQLKSSRPAKIVAFVVMPDHFHLIVNPRDGNIRDWTRALKSRTARRLIDNSPIGSFAKADGDTQVWQESFKSLPLWSGWMIWQKINYIHRNPLKAGLCKSVKDYRWSSFKSFYEMECEELMKVDHEWWWEDDDQKLTEAVRGWDEELDNRFLEQRKRKLGNKENEDKDKDKSGGSN